MFGVMFASVQFENLRLPRQGLESCIFFRKDFTRIVGKMSKALRIN